MGYDITAFLDEQVGRGAGRTALTFEGQHTSFGALDQRVKRLAGALRQAGLEARKDARVFVLDKNHPATIELTLAAAKAGVTCVIGNWRLAPEEIAWAVNDSRARILFLGHELTSALGSIRVSMPSLERVVVVGGKDDGYEAFLASGQPLVTPATHEDDDCFLQLYTSGTTGFPKGAMLTHRSVGAHTRMLIEQMAPGSDSVGLVPMPLFHVGGICWSLISLHAGGATVVTRDPSPASLLKTLSSEGVTHTFVVPAVLHGLLAQPDFAKHDLSRLRCVLYGGSPMPLPLLQKCLAALPCDLCQVWGMTEMSGVISVLDGAAHRDASHPERLLSAGRMVPGIELRVVDPSTGVDAKEGQVGEFWVRGEQRLKAYWVREEETRTTITPDGWLKTGDAGRVDQDGFVYIQDRVKDMVISGGENVYPAEIERVLQQVPGVAEVAVFGIPHEKWGETLCAAVVVKAGQSLTADELIAFSRQHLAGYKCPSRVDFISALPRNATGKVLKRDLRAPFWAGRSRPV